MINKNNFTVVDDASQPLQAMDATAVLVRRFNVSRSSLASVQLTLKQTSGAGARSIWSIKGSIDGMGYGDFATPLTITVGAGTVLSLGIDVTQVMSLEVAVSTVSTYTTEIVDLVVMRGDWE